MVSLTSIRESLSTISLFCFDCFLWCPWKWKWNLHIRHWFAGVRSVSSKPGPGAGLWWIRRPLHGWSNQWDQLWFVALCWAGGDSTSSGSSTDCGHGRWVVSAIWCSILNHLALPESIKCIGGTVFSEYLSKRRCKTVT